MNITNIVLNTLQISGNAEGGGIALSMAPGYEYADGKRTDTVSYTKVEVVFPDNSYEKIIVKVRDLKVPITSEQLAQQGGKKKVKFKNLTGKIYRTGNGEYAVSASADSLEVMQ